MASAALPPSDNRHKQMRYAYSVLWPGLDAVRRRLLWRKAGRSDEVSSEVLARATETLRGLALDRVSRIAATVLRNVERDALGARLEDVLLHNGGDVEKRVAEAEDAKVVEVGHCICATKTPPGSACGVRGARGSSAPSAYL